MMKEFNNTVKTQRGSTLLEIIITMSVVMLLVTGLVAATTNSVGQTVNNRVRSQAVAFAQEGMELTRIERDKGWLAFVAKSGLYCVGDDDLFTPAQACVSNLSNNFYTRSVLFAWNVGTGIMTVTVTVSWPEGNGTKSTSLISYLTQWK